MLMLRVVRCQQQNELRLQSSLTDASLAWLAPLKHLRTLGLRSCVMVEGGGLRHITGLSMLRSLDLTGCVRLTNKGAETHCASVCRHVCAHCWPAAAKVWILMPLAAHHIVDVHISFIRVSCVADCTSA